MRKRGLSQFFVSAYALTVLAKNEKNRYNKVNIKEIRWNVRG